VSADLRRLAERQLRDYDAADPGTVFGDSKFRLTVEEAYQLQLETARLRETRGESIAGYKIGCLSEAVRKQLGLNQPVIGHLFSSELHRSGARLDIGRYQRLAIEGEFAFRMAVDVPNGGWLAANLVRAIDAAFAVIELHNNVFRGGAEIRAQELIANNCLNAGVVAAAQPTRLASPEELTAETISVVRNHTELGSATGEAVPGGPVASLLRLTEMLESFGKKLRRGDLVLTGSPLPLYDVERGDRVEVRCRRLDGVSVSV